MIVRFGAFTLNSSTRELLCGAERRHLSTKAFDLLALLAARRPAVVEKAELRQHLWPSTHVVEAALANLVAEVRRALDEDPAAPTFLRTVHGIGYALAADASDRAAPGAPARGLAGDAAGPTGAAAQPAVRCWLSWKQREFTLAPGEQVIGRDPSCGVWIDAPGVSRRHARLTVASDAAEVQAAVEDLGSTNGTFAQGRRVTGRVAVRDGDEIKLGRVALTFRAWNGRDAPTKRVGKRR